MGGCVFVFDGVDRSSGGVALILVLLAVVCVFGLRGSSGGGGTIARTAHA